MKKIKYLLLLIPFLFISNVNADIVKYKFIDYVSTSSTMKLTNFTANETFTYSRDYVLFNGNDKFFAFNYCATGPFDFSFPNDFEGVTSLVGYSTGGHCYVQGYEGYNYTAYFMAKQVHDAGNGNLSIMFNTTVHNRASYNVFINVLSLSQVSSIPAGVQIPNYDGDFNTVNTKIDTVEQAVEEVKKAQNDILIEQKKTNETLTDDNTQQAQDSAGGFFNDFTTDTHGLTAIITAPLSLISKITSASCSPLVLPLPFVDKDLTLPCMGAIYSQYFGSFLSIYQVITFGIISYWVCVRIFNLVKDFKNPDHDEIEVLDL
jgi:hypothetical protein